MKIAFLGSMMPEGVFPDDAFRRITRRPGHAAPWVQALLPALARLGCFELRYIMIDFAFSRNCSVTRDGVTYEGISSPVPERFNRKTFYITKSILLRRALARAAPDLVHGFGFETGNALIALRSGHPVSAFVQGIAELYEPYYGERDWMERKVGVWGERVAARKVHWMVAENEFARRWAMSRNPFTHVEIIPHPTREVFFEKAAPSYGATVLAVGGLDERKGMDTVIRAFARTATADACLVVAGDGPLRGKLEQLAHDLGLAGRVEFTGMIGTEEVIGRMNTARVFVIGSRMDTSPNVVSEAYAIGLPVIGTAVGGIPEMIVEGEDGFLVPVDDEAALAVPMKLLLDNAPLAKRLGQAGRDKARTLNDPAKVAEAHARYFKRIGQQLGIL